MLYENVRVGLTAKESRVGGKASLRIRPIFLPATFATRQIFLPNFQRLGEFYSLKKMNEKLWTHNFPGDVAMVSY